MRALLTDLLAFLREHPVAWLAPLVAYHALLVWLAWREARLPQSPFVYEVF